ncbi:MAG: hypothetical protein QM753_04730 [Thermomicrobiales bacterium]
MTEASDPWQPGMGTVSHKGLPSIRSVCSPVCSYGGADVPRLDDYEGDFADAIAYGRFTAEEAEAIHAEASSLIPDIDAGTWPFDSSLIDWRPDSAWLSMRPTMPETWNEDFPR